MWMNPSEVKMHWKDVRFYIPLTIHVYDRNVTNTNGVNLSNMKVQLFKSVFFTAFLFLSFDLVFLYKWILIKSLISKVNQGVGHFEFTVNCFIISPNHATVVSYTHWLIQIFFTSMNIIFFLCFYFWTNGNWQKSCS